jgi:hypothetical protein
MGSCRLLAAPAAVLCFAVCAASAEPARFLHFTSPSGNINCTVGTGGGGPDSASCVVRRASWPHLPPKPRSCDLDWAATQIELTRTTVYLGSCRGDIGPLCVKGDTPCSVLGYGRSLTVGRIRCVSAVAGVTCRRTDGRHVGFRIAREGYRLYR